MYAVIETGGKQYRVAEGGVLSVEKLSGEAGNTVEFDRVLLLGGESGVTVGNPMIPSAKVTGEVLRHYRDRKILVFKKKRRKNYRKTRGHRQDMTYIRITKIEGTV
jgi:large subunit ribosomal protein L21